MLQLNDYSLTTNYKNVHLSQNWYRNFKVEEGWEEQL